jgi:hypothetical protein
MNRRRHLLLAVFLAGAIPMMAAAPKDAPSRPADKDCKWEKLSDANVGLDAWVEHCNYGFREIDFLFQGRSLAIRESDAKGKPDPLVDVLDLLPGETIEVGLKRIFASKTDPKIAKRCVLAPYKGENEVVPAGVKRYTFVPDARYQKEINKKQDNDGIGDPMCGDWGDSPDGIQYFEAHPNGGVARVLFVRVGQDVPLFDENTLRILPAKK